MPICALRTECVGVPTTPGKRVPFDRIQLTRRGTEHQYKNSGARASVHRRVKELIDVVGEAPSG
jgi:hypothetical protein